jgi:hypothetical protein
MPDPKKIQLSTVNSFINNSINRKNKFKEKGKEINYTQRDNTNIITPKLDKKLTAKQIEERRVQQLIDKQGTIKTSTPQSTSSKLKEISLNPLTAFGYAARNENLPENFSRGERNSLDAVIDVVNPAFYTDQGVQVTQNLGKAVVNLKNGQLPAAWRDYKNANINALNVLPLISEYKSLGRLANNAGKILSKEESLLSKFNPKKNYTLPEIEPELNIDVNQPRLNLERSSAKVKKKLLPQWTETQLDNGLIEQTPLRKGINKEIVKKVVVPNKGEIALKTSVDKLGNPVYYFSADVAEGGLSAGKAYKHLEQFIPKGSKILEQKSLSTDSFYNMMRRAENPKQFKWTNEEQYIPLNNSGKNKIFSNNDKILPGATNVKFEDYNEAKKALAEFNSRIKVEGMPKAKLSKIVDDFQPLENGPWIKKITFGIDVPNIGLIKQYKLGGNIEPPVRSAYENELMSRVITERNKDKNFVQRALNPGEYPYIVNDDGSRTTHLMQYSTDNNGNAFVSPTVIQNELGLLSKLTPREAVQYGRKTGEEIQIPNAQLADYYSSNGLIKHADGGQINNNLNAKYNNYLNNNMKRYAEGGTLNQFNEGGTHEQNPNGGIPQGPNAMVEQGETSIKTPNGKYIYSDRLYINEDLVKQFKLPNSIKGKTFAEASKVIDKPFKDKNSNPDKMTHKEHLNRLKQAQEAIKAEEAQKEQAILQNAQQSPGFENQQVPQGMEEFVGQQEMPQEGMEREMQQPGMSAYGGFIKRYDKGGMVDFLDENQGMFGAVDGIGKQFQSNRIAQPGDKGADAAKNMTTTALNAFIPGAGAAAGAADSLITGIAGDSKIGKGIASMVSPLGTIKGIGSALETGNISDMPMVGMFTGNSTFEKQKVQQARSSATSANNAFSDKFAIGGELEFTVSNPNNVAPMNYAPVNYVTTPTNSGQNIRFNSSGYSPLEMRNDKFIQEAAQVLRKDENGNIRTTPQLREYQTMYNYTKNAPDRYYIDKWLSENPGKTEAEYSKYVEKQQKAKDVGQQNLKNGFSAAGDACRTEKSSSTKDIKAEGGYMNYFDKGGDTGESSDNWFERNGSKMLKYAPIAMNAFQLSQLKKPSGVVLDRLSNRYKPTYMDENRIQNQVSNEMNNSVAGLTNATAGSESALRANLVGTTAGRIRGMSDAYAKMNEYNAGQNLAGQQFNLGVDQANIGQSNNQLEINDRNQANYRNQKSKLLGSIGTDLGSVGKEEVNKNSLAEALGYTWDGKFYVHNKTGAKKTAEQIAGETTQHAYGGYLKMSKIGRR